MAAVYDHHCVYADVFVLWQQFMVVMVYMFRHMFHSQQFMTVTVYICFMSAVFDHHCAVYVCSLLYCYKLGLAESKLSCCIFSNSVEVRSLYNVSIVINIFTFFRSFFSFLFRGWWLGVAWSRSE